MRKLIFFIFIAFFIFNCSSKDVENSKNKNKVNVKTSKLELNNKSNFLYEQYENAKRINSKEVWENLMEKSFEMNNEKIFNLAVNGAWDYIKADQEAMLGLAFFQIKTKEDYAKFIKTSYEKQKAEDKKRQMDEELIRKRTIRVGESIEVEGIKFQPKSICIKTFTYYDYSLLEKTKKTTPPILCMNIIIENITEGQVFAPVSESLLEISSYSDNFKNKHRYPFKGSLYTPNIEEFGISKKIKPKEKMNAYIPFDPPMVENSSEFFMDLYLVKSNDSNKNYVNSFDPDRTKAIVIKFTRNEISKNN